MILKNQRFFNFLFGQYRRKPAICRGINMKLMKTLMATMLSISLMLTGCTSASTDEGTKNTTSSAETNSSAEIYSTESEIAQIASSDTNGELVCNYLITNVYGDGQKPWLVVLEYSSTIDPESVSVDDYAVENYEIMNVYTNSSASVPIENVVGNYVLIELSTNYTNSGYTTSSDGPGSSSSSSSADGSGERPTGDLSETRGEFSNESGELPELSESPSGGMGGSGLGMVSEPSNQQTVIWTQIGEINGTDGTIYSVSLESYTTDFNNNDNLLVENFEQSIYTTIDGTTMMYNLYFPENYGESTSYPLVLFMPDATGEGSDAYLTLTESLGAVIWTTEYNQSNEACIILAPQYEETNSSDPTYTMELLQSITTKYSVDTNRLYLVGQSSGTIRSIKLLIDNPNTFAGALLVAGQAESTYEELLPKLANENIWMICSAGDERAYPGMTAIVNAIASEGIEITTAQWSADLTIEEQNSLAEDMANAGTAVNFTIFDAGTVMEDDVPVSAVTEHMNTWRVAYNNTTMRNWLLSQVNE